MGCYALGDEEFDVNGRVRLMESALLALSQGSSGKGARTSDVSRLYNDKRCNYCNCKYRHVCRWCGGAHAGCECRSSGKLEAGPVPSIMTTLEVGEWLTPTEWPTGVQQGKHWNGHVYECNDYMACMCVYGCIPDNALILIGISGEGVHDEGCDSKGR